MAREIKFRVWLKSQSLMLKDVRWVNLEAATSGLTGLQHSELLLQFTGLKDEKGVEIYEGDIVRNNFDLSVYKVKYVTKDWYSFCFINLSTNECNHLYEFDDIDIEVIGNIYENPELVK